MGIGNSLREKTLGIYGYGRLGSVVAGYGKAFGMRVLVWAREASLAKERADDMRAARLKEAFLKRVMSTRCICGWWRRRAGL